MLPNAEKKVFEQRKLEKNTKQCALMTCPWISDLNKVWIIQTQILWPVIANTKWHQANILD